MILLWAELKGRATGRRFEVAELTFAHRIAMAKGRWRLETAAQHHAKVNSKGA